MELYHELYSMTNGMLNGYLLGPTLQGTLSDRFRLISSDPNQVRQSPSFKFTYTACTHWPVPKRRSIPIQSRWSAMHTCFAAIVVGPLPISSF